MEIRIQVYFECDNCFIAARRSKPSWLVRYRFETLNEALAHITDNPEHTIRLDAKEVE